MSTIEVVARAESSLGELVLRRRRGATDEAFVYELISNGTFLMDSVDTSTERRLVTESLARTPLRGRVVVAGLGLGYTLLEVVKLPEVRSIDLVEIEGLLVDWARSGLMPVAHRALDDPRVRIHVDDIASYVARAEPHTVDVFLFDVDNGPDFLVYEENAQLYSAEFLKVAYSALSEGGVLTIWSSERSEMLLATMDIVFSRCEEIPFQVRRAERVFTYYLYVGTRTSSSASP